MSDTPETDALLVRDAQPGKAKLLLCTIHGMEFDPYFGDLLLTCALNDGEPHGVVRLMLIRSQAEMLTSFLKKCPKATGPADPPDRLPVVLTWDGGPLRPARALPPRPAPDMPPRPNQQKPRP